MEISACGLFCNDCPFFNKDCKGCYNLKGSPFWTKQATKTGICPIYDCSINQKTYSNCGECNELPCQIYIQLKDPNITDKEHQESIQKRVKNLRSK